MSRSADRRTIVVAVAVSLSLACRRGDSTTTGDGGDALPTAIAAVLERRCGSCHGLTADRLAVLGDDADRLLRWEVAADGRLATPAMQARARAACLAEHLVDRAAGADASPLLLAPLSPTYAGAALTHPEIFADPDDRDFVALQRWLRTEAPGMPPAALDEAGQVFAAEVMPVLERKGCLATACHGPRSFSDLKLEPAIPIYPGRYPRAVLERNRAAMLGALPGQARLAALDGDVARSRQLLKNVPVELGGVLHKGGNRFFEPGDREHRTLLRWLELEARRAQARVPLAPRDQGILFVRRPRATPERFFEDDAFLPGGDLVWRRPDGAELNLTAALHPGRLVDVRTPAVDYLGRHALFALRPSPDQPSNIWEIELATARARQLTFSTDPAVHWRDPIYAPDPDDRDGLDPGRVIVVMVSNAAGELALSSPEGLLGEAEGGDQTTILDDERSEPAGALVGRELRLVRGPGAGERRRIAASRPGRLVLDRPLPAPIDRTSHYVIAATPRMAPSYDLYRMRRAALGDERATFASTVNRMTWAAGQIRRPAMRSTGEIFVTALRSGWLGPRPFFHGAVFRVHHDGSNFHTHFGNRSQLPILAGNHELADGLEVRIGRDADSYWGGLVAIGDHQLGPPLDPRNPIDDADHPLEDGPPRHAQHAFTRSWVAIDPEVTSHGRSPGGAYRDVSPLPDGSLLVAHARGPLDLSDRDAAPDFDIVRLVPDPAFQGADGLSPGRFRRELVVGGPASELWPVAVGGRAKEPFHKALKHDEARHGKPGTHRGFPAYPDGTPALLEVFDLVLLAAFFEQTAPIGVRHLDDATCPVHGEATPGWRRITHARVVAAEPRRPGEHGPPRQRILTEAPLAADGSLQLLIPSGVPFDLQALSSDRLALSAPGRWLYAQPGERHALSIPRALYTQTCEGCHGALSGSRTSSFGPPDAVTSASRTQAMWDPTTGTARPPANEPGHELPEVTGPLALGFAEDVAPILARACAGCHGGATPAASLDLAGPAAARTLPRWLDPGGLSIRSPLVEWLLGRELDAPGAAPPVPHGGLAPADRLTITRWIDLGAPDRRAGAR